MREEVGRNGGKERGRGAREKEEGREEEGEREGRERVHGIMCTYKPQRS